MATETKCKNAGVGTLLLALGLLVNLSCTQSQNIEYIQSIDFYNKYQIVLGPENKIPIIDGRTEAMFAEGHIANAINIDADTDSMPRLIRQYEHEPVLIIYCTSNRRTNDIIKALQEFYSGDIIAIDDGIRGWKSNELPVVIPEKKAILKEKE